MNVTTENRSNSSRIAVFIDFDNVEIGVKNTLGGQFDIGVVLEAIKERGDIVTKVAYSDWKRAGDYSRVLTQHAIRMVQRNVTPGGDKNGADITMALDALELAFTHDHINTFVIVGGDSDFISLVEKLKQYGRKVIVVGGRQFTSATMQKNCHEFIAYENLSGATRSARPAVRGSKPAAGTTPIADALPLVRRALKVLSDREATPQLGLLKSTLLQLDSTFSEREYGASTFRDFMEKAAEAGAVTLRHAGRSIVVESREDGAPHQEVAAAPVAVAERVEPEPAPAPFDVESDEETLPPSPMTMQDGIRAVQAAFGGTATPPRWPMYVRQAKQFLRSAIEGFDERNYGFASVVDLLRAAGKEGVLRVERDRHGAIRVFPGAKLVRPVAGPVEESAEEPVAGELGAEPAEVVLEPEPVVVLDAVVEPPIVDVEAVIAASVETEVEEPPKRAARNRRTSGRPAKASARSKPARPRARKGSRGKTTASGSGE